MAALTRSTPSEQERLSHEMGMHTEQLGGRSLQQFFDIDLSETSHGFACPAPSMSISTSGPRSMPPISPLTRSICGCGA